MQHRFHASQSHFFFPDGLGWEYSNSHPTAFLDSFYSNCIHKIPKFRYKDHYRECLTSRMQHFLYKWCNRKLMFQSFFALSDLPVFFGVRVFFCVRPTALAFRYYYTSVSISSRDYAQPDSILGGYILRIHLFWHTAEWKNKHNKNHIKWNR